MKPLTDVRHYEVYGSNLKKKTRKYSIEDVLINLGEIFAICDCSWQKDPCLQALKIELLIPWTGEKFCNHFGTKTPKISNQTRVILVPSLCGKKHRSKKEPFEILVCLDQSTKWQDHNATSWNKNELNWPHLITFCYVIIENYPSKSLHLISFTWLDKKAWKFRFISCRWS